MTDSHGVDKLMRGRVDSRGSVGSRHAEAVDAHGVQTRVSVARLVDWYIYIYTLKILF
jgi:hypothetical protein